jgi:hypothetical protein
MASTRTCEFCDDTGWVCENHPQKPSSDFSKRSDACGCGAAAPCPVCNTPGPGEESDISRTGIKVALDNRHFMALIAL